MNLPGVDTQYILQDCYLLHSESWGGQSELVWGRHTVYITGLLLITFYHHSKDALGTTGWWWDGGHARKSGSGRVCSKASDTLETESLQSRTKAECRAPG